MRFSLRALMATTALSALAAWGWVLWGRSVEYARKAEEYLEKMSNSKLNVANLSQYSRNVFPSHPLPMPDWMKVRVDFYQLRADDAERLYRKYRRAAMFPWLTPKDDPNPDLAAPVVIGRRLP